MENNKETCFIITIFIVNMYIVQKNKHGKTYTTHVIVICFNIQVISIQFNE